MTVTPARRPLAVIAAVSAAFVAGITARGLVDAPSSTRAVQSGRSHVAATAPVPSSAGPVGFHDGIPAGFARSEDGARTAAAAFVLTGQVLIDLSPALVDGAVRSMSSSASADVQVATAQQQLE